MKTLLGCCILGGVTALGQPVVGQTPTPSAPAPEKVPVRLAPTLSITNQFQSQTNLFFPDKSSGLRRILKPNTQRGPLKPGLYKTAPYTSLVVVPESHPDERMVPHMGPLNMKYMPARVPGLEFIPRGAQPP